MENKSYFGEVSARAECRKECRHLSMKDFKRLCPEELDKETNNHFFLSLLFLHTIKERKREAAVSLEAIFTRQLIFRKVNAAHLVRNIWDVQTDVKVNSQQHSLGANVFQRRVTSTREYENASCQNLIGKICCEKPVCTWEKAQGSSTGAGIDPALCLSAP